jgi:hypothetical protein
VGTERGVRVVLTPEAHKNKRFGRSLLAYRDIRAHGDA